MGAAVKAVILGYGIRGRAYAAYARNHPDDLAIVAVAEPLASVRDWLGWPFFARWEEALEAGVRLRAEAAIIALPDRLHCAAAVAALKLGMHILLEKPIGCTWAECEAIQRAQRLAGRVVLAGYVLRYAPFYQRLAEIVRSGEIGELVSVHHLLALSHGKAAHAFCRGSWSVVAESSPMIVTKCTHDFDLIGWWLGARRCRRLASFGSLAHWRPECRPKGAAARCLDCPSVVRKACPFDAERLYGESDALRYHFADQSDAAMREVVAASPYGRCVYAGGNDAADHQTVLMEYEGGVTVTLAMESYTRERARITHFYGTRGEIAADGAKIEIAPFVGERRIVRPTAEGFHGGGDNGIMAEFVRLVRTCQPERSGELLEEALESHRLAFWAEASRQGEGRVAAQSVDESGL